MLVYSFKAWRDFSICILLSTYIIGENVPLVFKWNVKCSFPQESCISCSLGVSRITYLIRKNIFQCFFYFFTNMHFKFQFRMLSKEFKLAIVNICKCIWQCHQKKKQQNSFFNSVLQRLSFFWQWSVLNIAIILFL